jgi:polyferredoxin
MFAPVLRPPAGSLSRLACWFCLALLICCPSASGSPHSYSVTESVVAQPAELWCLSPICHTLLPEARSFEARSFPQPHVVGLRPSAQGPVVVGYILQTDPAPGYSGQPLRLLVGLDVNGRYTGVRLLEHAEPALRPKQDALRLQRYLNRYAGLLAGHLPVPAGDDIHSPAQPDTMTGATVSLLAMERAIASGSQQFALETGIPGFEAMDVQRLLTRPGAERLSTRDIWAQHAQEALIYGLALILLGGLYWQRDRLARHAALKGQRMRTGLQVGVWIFSIGFTGSLALAQVSVTQVLTWFKALVDDWHWALFLSEPLIFLSWVFIILSILAWGRGLFCGWLCPFGALSALLHRLARLAGLERWQFSLPDAWHRPLGKLKYLLFITLLLETLQGGPLPDWLEIVEPFEAVFRPDGGLLGPLSPATISAFLMLGLALFVERPYCKYLCPLGAALAMPSTFRWFGLKRKFECTDCQLCAQACSARAIDPHGNIDNRECMACLGCQQHFYDAHTCPPLAQERRYREADGMPLTRIDSRGYFTPLAQRPSRIPKES